MYPFLLLLTLLPSISAFVDCRTACRKCREKNDLPKILDVYCSMCEVCKERSQRRLREKKAVLRADNNVVKTTTVSSYQTRYGYSPHYPGYPGYVQPMYPPVPIIQAIPDGCPMSSLCNSSEEVSMKLKPELEDEDTIMNTTNLQLAPRPVAVAPIYRRVINMPMVPYPVINMDNCPLESQSMPASASEENTQEVVSTDTTPNVVSIDTTLSVTSSDPTPNESSTDTPTTDKPRKKRYRIVCKKPKSFVRAE